MIPSQFFLKSDLDWREPIRFRAECSGGNIRIRWPSHVFFLVIALGYIGYHFVTGGPDQSGVGSMLGGVGFGVLFAYISLMVAKYQPSLVRITPRGIVCLRAEQVVVLPIFVIMHWKFGAVGSCVIAPVSCGGVEIESVVFLDDSGEEILKVGLSRKVKKADVVEVLERRGVPCEVAR